MFTESDDDGEVTIEFEEGSMYQKRDKTYKDLVASKMSKRSGMTLQSAKSKAATERALKKVSKAENPGLGTAYFILYCAVKSSSVVLSTILYNRVAALTPFQFLFMRSAMAIVLLIGSVNVNLKRDTWDCVTKDGVGSLIGKTFTGTTTNIIGYALPKYLPLTLISVVNNLSPIIVVTLAYLILKERLKKFEWLMLALTITGIFVYVIGGSSEADSPTGEEPSLPYWVLYLFLFLSPILSAAGTIAMRQMKKFSDSIVAWY